LRGVHQLSNAAACITALDTLRERLPITAQDVRNGLVRAEVAGRFQVLPGSPSVILDVAHNPHAAQALAANLAVTAKSPNTIAVFSMLKDKDIAGVRQRGQEPDYALARSECWWPACGKLRAARGRSGCRERDGRGRAVRERR
jgi:folylpolyglutamate synthase/dihydropteroate synthase